MQGYTYFFPIAYSATDQVTYQQDVVIHRSEGTSYEETVGDFNVWHVYVGNRCKSDYGDIRFTDASGNALAYYLWPDYDSSSARFTVRLEGADSDGSLFLWYGNPTAATTSNETATYYLHDLFEGSAINGAKWSHVLAYMVSEGYLQKTETGNNANSYLYTDVSLPPAWVAEAHVVNGMELNRRGGFAIFDAETHYWAAYIDPRSLSWWVQATDGTFSTENRVGWPTTPISATQEYLYRVQYVSGVATGSVINPTTGEILTSGSTQMTPNGRVGFHIYDAGTQIADILIRAYSATPPAATAFGPEQAPGSLHHVQGVVFGSANMMVI